MPPKTTVRAPGRRLTRGTRGTLDNEGVEQHDLDTNMRDVPANEELESLEATMSDHHPQLHSDTAAPPSSVTAGAASSPTPRPALQAPSIAEPQPATSKNSSTMLKVKPKIVRRSVEDRLRSEREEEERARLKSRETPVTNNNRGNPQGRTGRLVRDIMHGRGGVTPILQGRKAIGAASGPFGQGSVSAPTVNSRRGRAFASRESLSTSRAGSAALKRESASGTKGGRREGNVTRNPRIKTEDSIDTYYVSSDEENAIPRIDVKNINNIDEPLVIEDDDDDDDEEPITSHKRSIAPRDSTPNWGLKPVTMDRKEHVNRSGGIQSASADPEILRKKARERGNPSLFITDPSEDTVIKTSRKKKNQDVEMLNQSRKWTGVYTDSEDEEAPASKPKVKKELVSATEVPEVDFQSSATVDHATPLPETIKTRPKAPKRRARAAPYTTEEEHQEWSRQITDIDTIARELQLNGLSMPAHSNHISDPFSSSLPQDTPSTTAPASTPATPMPGDPEDKEGRLYVFQFPSLLPDLYNPLEPPPTASSTTATQVPISKADSSLEAPRSSKTPQLENANTKKPIPIKPDPAPTATIDTTATPKDHLPASSSIPPPPPPPPPPSSSSSPPLYPTKNPPGFAGYLSVHRSRRVRLCWGGFDFDVSRGADVSFAENAVVVSSPVAIPSSSTSTDATAPVPSTAVAVEGNGIHEERGDAGAGRFPLHSEPEKKGIDRVTSMGAIRGKMVVVPDWGRALDSSLSSSLSSPPL